MNDVWRYVVTPRAARDLRQLDSAIRQRVLDALDRLVARAGQGDIHRLVGTADEYRLRVGDWRVRYRVAHLTEPVTPPAIGNLTVHEVVALRVLPRGRAYRE